MIYSDPASFGLRTGATALSPPHWWLGRDAARNWIALGLLLAAWNAVDDRAPSTTRPSALRGYESVSVRAVNRTAAEP